MEVADSAATADFLKCGALVGAESEFALKLLALVGDLAGFLLGLHHVERIACGRRPVESEYQRGSGGTGLLYALVALVEHRLDLTVVGTGKDYVADMECTVLYEDICDIAASLVKR